MKASLLGKYKLLLPSLLIFLSSTQVASAAENYVMPEKPFSIELGYAKTSSANKASHYEILDYSLSGNQTNGYRKRKLKGTNGFYLSFNTKPIEQVRVGLEYIQTGRSRLNVTNHISSVGLTQHYRLSTRHRALLLNANYHPITWNNLSPYVGLGLGLARNKVYNENIILDGVNEPNVVDLTRNKKSSTSLAWSLQAGVNYMINDSIYINTSYKFLNFGRIKGSTKKITNADNTVEYSLPNLKGHVRSHVFMVGVGYQF